MPQAPSTRWCPTPEQLMILEEMYRAGVRTPNAPQIQQITAHLACYGKIEGKNVFYWFQNHKARDRQKLRRRLISRQQQQMNLPLPQFYPQLEASAYPSVLHPHQIFHQISPHFLHQGCYREGTEPMNLISKLEASEGEQEPPEALRHLLVACPDSGYRCHERVTAAEARPSPVPAFCCKPAPRLTLDLFPTRSTGLREEGGTSKSSPCFTS